MPKLRNPQVVKIFFSSPFGGMEEEREELTRRYLPSIQHLCKSYGLQFAAVDMRWGITAESSEKAQVINICLRELDRSDMFIGFFGQRYGWHGANDESLQQNFDNALPQYPWLDQFRDKSVTELEFLHGFLNNPGLLPASIFFRDKVYDDMMRQDGLQKGDKKQVFKYSTESELSSELMDDLKQRVWAHRDESLGVYMDYKTPAEAAKIMYDTIMTYLKDTLLVELTTEKHSARDDLLSQHDAFLASRCNIFVHGEAHIEQLNKQVLADNGQKVLLTGGAGSGKSALLCNWIASLKQDNRNLAVVYHFVGFADSSTDVNSMLARLSSEFEFMMSKLTDGTAHVEESSEDSQGEENNYVKTTLKFGQKLLNVLDKLVSLGKTPVLVIDGLDKVTVTKKIRKVLFWLPFRFPPSVTVVVSTLESDIQTIDELGTRNYLRINIDPLPNDAVHEMSVKTLHASGKELSPQQLKRIVAAEMSKNPLFLKITLSELVAFGYFRMLDKKIDSLTSSESTEALLQLVLTRLEEDYNVSDYHGNLVERVMCGVHLSSQGLTETELKEIFSIPDHVWSPLYFAIEYLTINQLGRIQFGYKELGEAVCARYLQDLDKKQYILKNLIEYFTVDLEQLTQSDCVDGGDLITCRPAYELPPLFLEYGDMAQLADCLTNFFIFSHLGRNTPYLLIEIWQKAGLKEEGITERLLASFDKRVAEIYLRMEEQCILGENKPPGFRLVEFLTCAENVMEIVRYKTARKTFLSRAIDIVEDGLKQGKVKALYHNQSLLNNLKYRLACVYCEALPTAEQGIKLHKELLKQYESQLETTGPTPELLTDLGHSAHGIGVGYATLDQFNEVEPYVTRSIKYHEESGMGSLVDIGASWGVLALCCLKTQDYEKALHYNDKAKKAYETHHFGETPPIIGELLTNKALCLKRMGRIEEAEATYKESLTVKINAVGRQHEIVAMAYINLCALEGQRGNYDVGKQYAEQAVQIYEAVGNARHNPQYLASWENLIMCLVMKESFAEADEYVMRILKWRIEDGTVDYGLGTVYCDVAKYYLREGMFEKAYFVLHALMGSRFREDMDCIMYILIDIACQSLPETFGEQLEMEYTLAYAVEKYPENVSLVKLLIENHLVPSNDSSELARLVNRLHSHSDMGDQVYVLTCEWCKTGQGEINEECQQAIIAEGLLKYPDNLDLHLSMAKSYRRLGQAELALPHALRVVDQQEEMNPPLVMFTAHTALLAGDCDVCDKWCAHLLENLTDEKLIASVNELMKNSKEVREYQQQQPEEQPEQEQQQTE